MRGGVLSVLKREVINIAEMALSPDREKVAFLGEDRVSKRTGLFYGWLGSSDLTLAVETSPEGHTVAYSSIGWSVNGTRLVFSRMGKVNIYDI